MSNILKITTPVSGYDNTGGVKINQSNLPQNNNIQGQVIPDKVVKPDARSDSASQQTEAQLKFRYETNFDNFIQQMQKSASMTESFSVEFLAKLGVLAQSGLKKDFAQEISKFLSMIRMSPEELSAFLKIQGESSVRFSGTLFNVLRQLMQQTSSVELRTGILDFLKRYTDMAEGNHLLENIRQVMQQIQQRMFAGPRQQVEQMAETLTYHAAQNGNVKDNAAVLKNEILPFLNEYITAMHDRGGLRDNTALLAALTARYENGDTMRMQEAFLKLLEFPEFSKLFQNLDPARLLQILSNTAFEQASARNSAMDKLAELIKRGCQGEAGIENKTMFRELLQAFLLNESVYMPVLHLTLPLDLDGNLLFSELWIDPDERRQKEDGAGEERMIRGLIKFDIQNIGFFDLFFLYGVESGKIRMQLNYPQELPVRERELRNALEQILTQNGMQPEEMILGTEGTSIPLSEAFPHVYERKNSVNVTV